MSDLHKPTERVIRILEHLSLTKGGFGLAELSENLNIPKGTLFPILRTLVNFKYLEFKKISKTYNLGIKLFTTGVRCISNSHQYKMIDSYLQTITDVCNETSQFGILENGNVLYLAKVDSTQSIRIRSSIGTQLPAYATAIGKALLVDHSLEELKEIYSERLNPLTKKTIQSYEELELELSMIRETGFAYEIEESNEFIRCIAKPLRSNGKVVAAVSVAIPIFRYSIQLEGTIKDVLIKMVPEFEVLLPFILS